MDARKLVICSLASIFGVGASAFMWASIFLGKFELAAMNAVLFGVNAWIFVLGLRLPSNSTRRGRP